MDMLNISEYLFGKFKQIVKIKGFNFIGLVNKLKMFKLWLIMLKICVRACIVPTSIQVQSKNSQDFILIKKVYQETFRKKELQGTSRLYCKLPVTVVNIAQLRLSCWRLHLEKVSVVARLIWLSLCDIYTYSMFTCYCLFFDKVFTGLCTLYSFVSYPWFSTSTPSNLSPVFFFAGNVFLREYHFIAQNFKVHFIWSNFFFVYTRHKYVL